MKDLTLALGDFISSQSCTFTVGGKIHVSESSTTDASRQEADDSDTDAEEEEEDSDSVSPPIVIRYDASGRPGSPVQFPVVDQGDGESLKKLIAACEPASSAVDKTSWIRHTVYQGPSGFFKPHVDTPRKGSQFGSLVVCLPCHHVGGSLVVKHGSHDAHYDWDAQAAQPVIQWAAFYSDCEHEVHEVTEGYRVTLTYNLYSAPRAHDIINHLGAPPAPVQIESLPLYKKIQDLLGEESFMTEGGILGIYSSHAYPYNPDCVARPEDLVLKGSDMALHAVFQALGLEVDVRPVLPDITECYKEVKDSDDESEEESEEELVPLVGRFRPGRVDIVREGGYYGDIRDWVEGYFDYRHDVTWITSHKYGGLGMVHLTYGNETGVDWFYTFTALLVTIPPASDESRGRIEEGSTASSN